ncbi:MAG TPA: hypothetical protein VJ044_12360 [Candidatus Hodarchaeales archaeon]|nr:hypothetical protein [Candidatus Hodarchaeales archaeon]
MARVVIYLLEPEMNEHIQLVQQEYKPITAQATLIVRNTRKRLGMVREQLVDNEMGLNKSSESGCGGTA